MNSITVPLKELEQAEQDALTRVRAWVIESHIDYSALDSYCRGLLNLKKKIVEDFRDAKSAASLAHKAICSQESGHLDAVEQAIKDGKVKLFEWDRTQEKIRQEKEEALRAAARKLADDEALEAAELAAEAGDKEGAASILEEAAQAPAPVVIVPKETPKRQTVIRMVRQYKIVKPSDIKSEFMTPDTQKIGGVVRSMGKAAEVLVGGIEVFEVPV